MATTRKTTTSTSSKAPDKLAVKKTTTTRATSTKAQGPTAAEQEAEVRLTKAESAYATEKVEQAHEAGIQNPAPVTPLKDLPTPMRRVLEHIDDTGKALKKALDALWVEWNEETQSGAVHWHAGAESGLRVALQKLVELEDAVRRVPYPEKTS